MTRILFNILGTLALILAVLGIFLPLLPTTPFLLLAAACYMRGSRRMYDWLISHRIFGPYILDFQTGRGIPLHTKVLALAMMWPSLAVSAWIMPVPWARWLLLIPGLGVTVYLLHLPTRSHDEDQINRE